MTTRPPSGDAEQEPGAASTRKPGGMFGTGATGAERALVHVAALAGLLTLLVTVRLEPPGSVAWAWWQYVIGGILVFDLAGGVVALALNSAKRFYQGTLPPPRTPLRRFMHSRIGFTAAHVQPIVIGLLFGGPWWWGPLWYGYALAGVVLLTRTPLYLARPTGALIVLVAAMAAPPIPAPFAFEWLPAVLALKLVLGHGVPEQPYERAVEGTGADG